MNQSTGEGETLRVTAFLSVQSPYCYFAVPRLEWLTAQPEVDLAFRQVLPGVLRLPGTYASRSEMERAYFNADVARTSEFLGMPYAEARPDPVVFEQGSVWIPAAKQPRARALVHLVTAAEIAGSGLAAYAAVMRLIWDGSTVDWHLVGRVEAALAAAGLDAAALADQVAAAPEALDRRLEENAAAMLAAGHWGAPCFETGGEAFYGQDRMDQLMWRLGLLERFRQDTGA